MLAMESMSVRGRSNITEVIPRIPKKLLQVNEDASYNKNCKDLFTAENWLILDEVL